MSWRKKKVNCSAQGATNPLHSTKLFHSTSFSFIQIKDIWFDLLHWREWKIVCFHSAAPARSIAAPSRAVWLSFPSAFIKSSFHSLLYCGCSSLSLAGCRLLRRMGKRDEMEEKLAALEWNSLAAEEPPAHNPQSFPFNQPLSSSSNSTNQFDFINWCWMEGAGHQSISFTN